MTEPSVRTLAILRAKAFLRGAEELRLKAYPDTGGVLTIGYGHTGDVSKGQTCTKEHAEELLTADVMEVCQWLDRQHPEVWTLLNANQAAAVISWLFNVGCPAATTSATWGFIKSGDLEAALKNILKWNKGRLAPGGPLVVIKGLLNRRNKEAALWKLPVVEG